MEGTSQNKGTLNTKTAATSGSWSVGGRVTEYWGAEQRWFQLGRCVYQFARGTRASIAVGVRHLQLLAVNGEVCSVQQSFLVMTIWIDNVWLWTILLFHSWTVLHGSQRFIPQGTPTSTSSCVACRWSDNAISATRPVARSHSRLTICMCDLNPDVPMYPLLTTHTLVQFRHH